MTAAPGRILRDLASHPASHDTIGGRPGAPLPCHQYAISDNQYCSLQRYGSSGRDVNTRAHRLTACASLINKGAAAGNCGPDPPVMRSHGGLTLVVCNNRACAFTAKSQWPTCQQIPPHPQCRSRLLQARPGRIYPSLTDQRTYRNAALLPCDALDAIRQATRSCRKVSIPHDSPGR